jgi:hypothetical protein
LRTHGAEAPPSNVVTLAAHRDKAVVVPDEKGVYPHPNGKFAPEIHALIVAAVRSGNYVTTAAGLAGIHVQTLYRWLSKGESDEDSKYRQFYLDMQMAEAESEVSIVSIVRAAANIDYRAGLELLSRRFPERWSSKNRTELTGQSGAPVELVISYEDEHAS